MSEGKDKEGRRAHAPAHAGGYLEVLEARFRAASDSHEAGHAALLAVAFAAHNRLVAPDWAADAVASIVEAYETHRIGSVADAFGMPDRSQRVLAAGRRGRDALRLAARLQQIRKELDFDGRPKSGLVAREELEEELGGAYTAPQIQRIVSQWRVDLHALGMNPDVLLRMTDLGTLLGDP